MAPLTPAEQYVVNHNEQVMKPLYEEEEALLNKVKELENQIEEFTTNAKVSAKALAKELRKHEAIGGECFAATRDKERVATPETEFEKKVRMRLEEEAERLQAQWGVTPDYPSIHRFLKEAQDELDQEEFNGSEQKDLQQKDLKLEDLKQEPEE